MVEHTPTVLLIEQDLALRELEAQVLGDAGYHVEELPEEADPLAIAKQTRPSVIVIGIRHDDTTGWQAVDQLRSDSETRAVPLVVISTSQRTAAQAAATTNVSETVVAPYDITTLETAVSSAIGKPPAAATLPAATHPAPAYLVVAADALQQESRAVVLRAIESLLRSEPYRNQFPGITPELVDNLGLLLGAIVEGLRKDLSPEQVFSATSVQKTIVGHVCLRKSQGLGLDTVVRETLALENCIDRTLTSIISASFSAADALVVVDKVRLLMQALVLTEITQYSPAGGS